MCLIRRFSVTYMLHYVNWIELQTYREPIHTDVLISRLTCHHTKQTHTILVF
jgi:hypothetical protein